MHLYNNLVLHLHVHINLSTSLRVCLYMYVCVCIYTCIQEITTLLCIKLNKSSVLTITKIYFCWIYYHSWESPTFIKGKFRVILIVLDEISKYNGRKSYLHKQQCSYAKENVASFGIKKLFMNKNFLWHAENIQIVEIVSGVYSSSIYD